MSRTRLVFVAIISVTLLIICGVLGWQFIDDNGRSPADNQTSTANATAVPEDAILITIASSNTKENWLDQVVTNFNGEQHTTPSGKVIIADVSHVTSGGSMNSILEGSLQPTGWSPGDQSWVEQANNSWQQINNKPLSSQDCLPTIYAPLGFAMWRPMAETLGWPDTPIGWEKIVELAADPDGWASYGRPEWGQFQFGHTHPAYANSGLLSMTSFVYGIAGQNLTANDIYSDKVQNALRELEQNTSKYGRQAPALLESMAREGPSYLHAAAVPEADTVRFNVERGDELAFPLAFIFPAGGTIWANHPFCILDNADWVTEEEAEATAVFRDYLRAPSQQELAIDNYLRPLDKTIPLHDPLTLDNGTDPRANPQTIPALPSPNNEISSAITDIFQLNKRKATVIVLLDVSGSMEGDKIKTARTATVQFLERLHPDDHVSVMIFSDLTTQLNEPERVGNVVEGLSQRIDGLLAHGNTALYDAVCQATEALQKRQANDIVAGESRLYGIILLSDGEDTVGRISENQMFATCLPNNAEADGIKIYPIAFGDEADQIVLQRIANVTGGRLFTADPNSINNVYISISAEQ